MDERNVLGELDLFLSKTYDIGRGSAASSFWSTENF
jgi:hypothetical protein